MFFTKVVITEYGLTLLSVTLLLRQRLIPMVRDAATRRPIVAV